jgi:hypothetical protein
MRLHLAILATLLLLATTSALSAVELTVEEPAGIERIMEPVTCGVPLPEGYASSVGELVLSLDGSQQPVEVREVSRWPDGSLRWVHLDFQLSVPPNESRKLVLDKGGRQALETRLEAIEEKNEIKINTGKMEVHIRRARFNVIDMLRVAGEEGKQESMIIPHHGGGIVAWSDSVPYRSSLDPSSELTVESSGPMRVVLRSRGRLVNKQGNALLHYTCRLYFYNDSPVVRMALSVENQDSVIESKVVLEGLHVEIPTLMRGDGIAFDIGMIDEDFQDVFGQKTALSFSQVNDSEQAYFGSEMHWEQDESPKEAKSDRIGWASLGAGAGQVGVGLRYFWQMHPSTLVLFAHDGFIQVGMFPKRLKRKMDWYAGVARTHYLRFAFLRMGDADRMRSMVTACQKPLIARATPEYYCDISHAFGRLPARGGEKYPDAHRQIAANVDSELEKGFDNMLKKIDNRSVNGVTHDSYGLMNWGDGIHYAWQKGINEPGNLSWNNNYYDLPHMSCLEFARTGSLEWYEYFFTRSNHVMDLHMTHFGPDSPLTGHNRYNPATEHVRLDPTVSGDYTSAKVHVHTNQAHSKTQGLFDRWLLCGDERARDVALQGLSYAATFGGYADFKQPRGAAHQVLTLVNGYHVTGDRKWLEVAGQTFDKWWEHFQGTDEKFISLYFQVGFLLEAFIDYHEASGDPRVIEFVKQAVDWMVANRPDDKFPSLALGAGFVAVKTNDSRYTEIQKDYLSHWQGVQGNAFKDFAMHGRNVARSLYYLTEKAWSK